MWLIALLALVLWSLSFERCWYLWVTLKRDIRKEKQAWDNYQGFSPRSLGYFRIAAIGKLQQKIDDHLGLLKTLILLCPLLGLLGTVTGMITVFDVISFDNMGDLKLMAGGISKATIPTMTSMVVSISGIFVHSFIKKTAISKKQMISHLFNGGSNA